MFVFSFDIFDQRQGFGFRAVFVMLCDGPRRGRAGETREGGLRRAGETQEGGAGAGETQEGGGGGQVKPSRGARRAGETQEKGRRRAGETQEGGQEGR